MNIKKHILMVFVFTLFFGCKNENKDSDIEQSRNANTVKKEMKKKEVVYKSLHDYSEIQIQPINLGERLKKME